MIWCQYTNLKKAGIGGGGGSVDRLEDARENIEQAGIAFDSLLTTDDLGIVKN